MNDWQMAFRQLLKRPGFAVVAVISLAMGIGANTVVFSLARVVMLRPLGYDGEDRLVWLRRVNTQTGAIDYDVSWRDLEDVRAGVGGFEAVVTDSSHELSLDGEAASVAVPVAVVTPSMVSALRLRPVLGRLLLSSDAEPGAEPAVVLSYEAWQGRYAGDTNVLGRNVRLDGVSRTVVGVLSPGVWVPRPRVESAGFEAANRTETHPFWIAMTQPRGSDATHRGARMFRGFGRLKPGVTESEVRAELDALGRRLAVEYPESNRPWTFESVSFRDQMFGRVRHGIPLLVGAVVVVLLIGCVNLANLLLARGVSRQREMAVRLALGAGVTRLVRSALAESMVLAGIGGAMGMGLAWAALEVIQALGAGTVPFLREASVDAVAVLFTGGLSLATALAFGLLPAFGLGHANAVEALRSGTRSTAGPRLQTWQQTLVVGQVAVVLVLLASAGLLLESFRRLMSQDLGYRPDSVVAADLSTPGFPTNGDVCRMYRTLRERLAAIPGVTDIGTISSAPLTGKWTFHEKADVVGASVPEADRDSLAATFVAFGYFQAMGIPLKEGRFFDDVELKDDGYGQKVILNETAAKRLFPGRSAVGGRYTVGSNPDRVLEVVGVVKDTRDVRLEEAPQARMYWQYAFGGAQVVVRGSTPAEALIPRIRDVVQGTDARVRIESIRPMTDIVDATVAERRFLMVLVTGYAVLALVMALVGMFGVIAYHVAQRSNEFGVRIALGSSPGAVMILVLRQALQVAAVGVGVGWALSLGTGRFMGSQLYQLSPNEPWMLGGVSLLVLAAAAAASLVPARRAAGVDPMVVLRGD